MAKTIKDLPIGTKVRYARHQINAEEPEELIWQIGGIDHYKNELNPGIVGHTTLVPAKIIDIRAFDAKEPNNNDTNRKNYGNNRYKDSNIRQWLNKSGPDWFEKTHSADEPPTNAGTNNYGTGYDDRNGFLTHFTEDELAAIVPVNLTVAKNTVTDGGGTEEVTDRVFLLSNTEVGLVNEPGGAEGEKLPLFTNDTSRIGIVTKQVEDNSNYDIVGARHWWLRSPSSSYSSYVRYVLTSGALSDCNAFIGNFGVRPALNLESSILVSEEPDEFGVYDLIYAPPHKLLFKEGEEIKIFQDNLWEVVGQAEDELDPIFEEFGMGSLTGISGTDLVNKKLLIQKEEGVPQVSLKAVPKPQLVLPSGDLILKMLDKIHHFKIFANQIESGIIRIVFSVNGGDDWLTYNSTSSDFEEIDIVNINNVKENGVNPDTFNTIGEKWNNIIVDNKIRFAYYLEQDSIDGVAAVDKLEIKMDIQGRWKKAEHIADYDYEYDNEHLYITFNKDGSYKVNFQK